MVPWTLPPGRRVSREGEEAFFGRMKAPSASKEIEHGCASSLAVVPTSRAWKKQSRKKSVLGNQLQLSSATAEVLGENEEIAKRVVSLSKGRHGRMAPFFQRVAGALVDYQKESWTGRPSKTSSRGSTLSTGSGYASVLRCTGLEDGRSQSDAPMSRQLSSGSEHDKADCKLAKINTLAAAATPDAIKAAGDGPIGDSRQSTVRVSFARVKQARFHFADGDGGQVCQLAKSTRRAEKGEGISQAWTMMKAVPEGNEEKRTDTGNEKHDDDENSEKELTHFQAFDFAQRLNLPSGQVTDAWRQFKRYDSRDRGRLTQHEFQLLLRSILRDSYPRARDIPRELLTISARDGKEGDIGFSEFLMWVSQHAFSEAFLLTPHKQLLRAKARELEVAIPLVENIRQLFDEFDDNKNNLIEYPEFCKLFTKLMGCQHMDKLPDARTRTFWMQIQGTGSGSVSFDSFLAWYLRFCDTSGAALGSSPLEDYYESIRPCCVSSGSFLP